MADTKISNLPLKSVPVSSDVTIIVDSVDGLNKKIQLQNLPTNENLDAQLATKLNDNGDTVTGQYTITHSGTGTNAALNLWNQNSSYITASGFQNDTDGCGMGILNSVCTSIAPANPGDAAIGLSGIPSSLIFVTKPAGSFKIIQDVGVALQIANGVFSANKIKATPVDIPSLTTKTTPVGNDDTFVRDVTNAVNYKINLGSLPITTSQSTRLTNFQDSLYVRYVPTAATNSTTYVLIDSVSIPAGTFSSGDTIDLKTMMFEKVGVTNSATFQMYINSSNTLTGATAISSSSIIAANQYGIFTRKFLLAGGLIYTMSLASSSSDVTGNASTWATATFNTAANNWILLAVKVTNAADTIKCLSVQWDRK